MDRAVEEAHTAVCEICGSSKNQEVMVNCTQCNAYRHCYCLEVVAFEIKGKWCCYECQKNANGDPEPIQGEKTEFQRPLHGCDLRKESKTPILDNNCRNKTPQRYENSKVKYIPCEEAALLSKERWTAHNRPKFVVRHTTLVHPASPNMKCMSPSRQVLPALRNVKPSSSMKSILPSMKQSRSMVCVSPSRSETEVFASQRCTVASQNTIKVDVNMQQRIQSGIPISKVLPHSTKGEVKENVHQLQDAPREVKVASADKGASNSWADDQHSGESAFSSSDADIGCESGSKSLHHHIDMPVIINSSVEYARRPPPQPICWTGCFLASAGENIDLGEFEAYLPSRVSSKVRNITKKMPNNLQLEIQPRMNYWPKAFEKTRPVYNDIALLFFPTKLDCNGKKRPRPLEIQCGFAMKTYVDDMMLLIYNSEVLPPDSQWIDGESYLWGVFLKPRLKSSSARFGSVL
ncbi:uncharacterized protein LOC104584403 isoform X2 [Brachypodium distachyon]|uniref:uncharacterized protein LOC104584403 isoform X2 n=1 Tax=Brachypodium distachyon TaxID=15368 RepID=UPI000530086A|nr:uncharacterized protein LOC104584403 isoform X2 [Brachypodium distachyon]|eukprot:XP_010237272.1 uncharacterized protein LOC104584403 isoform X2 [Brachypodium distachyon]